MAVSDRGAVSKHGTWHALSVLRGEPAGGVLNAGGTAGLSQIIRPGTSNIVSGRCAFENTMYGRSYGKYTA